MGPDLVQAYCNQLRKSLDLLFLTCRPNGLNSFELLWFSGNQGDISSGSHAAMGHVYNRL
jgi:hypothetical protein